MKTKIQIVYHIDWIDEVLSPVLCLFYLKTDSDILFYKSMKYSASEIIDSGCTSPYDFFDMNFVSYEDELFDNNDKATIKNVDDIFDNITNNYDHDPFYDQEKAKLYSIIRKNKIDQIIN